MEPVHLDRDATAETAIAAVKEHGYVIIDQLASPETMDQVQSELQPYIDRTETDMIPDGDNVPYGSGTRRTGALIARSPASRNLIANPTVLEVCQGCLPQNVGFHLSLAEVISLYPGEEAQYIHQDELGYGGFPFPPDYWVQISTLWAMSDYTEEMGATRIIPGSHRLPTGRTFEQPDTVPAVMERGSVLIYSAKLYHGGGANRSDKVRQAMNVNYAVSWTAQEQNQFLSCPPEIARTLPESLLKLMGYKSDQGWNHVNDRIDPLDHLFGRNKRIRFEPDGAFGALLDAGEAYRQP